MSATRQLALTIALVALVALAAVVANLALLRSTEDSSDPVGRLSPRAVFSTPADTSHGSGTVTKPADDGGGRHSGEPDD